MSKNGGVLGTDTLKETAELMYLRKLELSKNGFENGRADAFAKAGSALNSNELAFLS